ncbi:MAG: hypothetical protein IJ496_07035 [Ruminococcus sp.]|nr:hypothetical protein [Ruminococcus sp.]
MTTFKKIFAAATAAATVGVLSLTSIPASAADITYNGPGEYALTANDDGSTVRVNIYNDWTTNKVKDIDPAQTVIDYIEVEFTITGLNGRTCNVNEDGTDADAYTMSLCGTIGTDKFWGKPDEDTTTPGTVSITGDGTYTVRTNLTQPADTVLCLLLSSNINFYQLGENVTGIADSGVNVTVNAIRTGDEAPAESGEGEGSTTTTTTGAGGGSTTTTTTTQKANSGSTSNNNSSNNSSKNNSSTSNSTTSTVTKTADAGVVAIVVGAAAAASLAAGAMTIKRKRK